VSTDETSIGFAMNEHPVTIFDLNAYAAGDISDMERRSIEAHVVSCERCKSRLAAINKERTEFLASHPFDKQSFADRIKASSRKNILFFPASRSLLAIAASLLFAFGAVTYFNTIHNAGSSFRSKGTTAELALFVLGDSGKPEQRLSAVFHPSERIQFTYSIPQQSYFLLASMDTTGACTVYYPSSGDNAMVLHPGAGIPLPNSIILDNYLGPEAFIGIFMNTAFPVQQAVGQLMDEYQKSRSFNNLSKAIDKALIQAVIIEKTAKDNP
jgi:hypothetical protein